MVSGRKPLARGVYCFEDCPPPDELVLDTSFVVAALNSGEPHHEAAVAYLRRLTSSQSLVVYNRLLEIELVEVAFKLAVKERHGSRGWPAKRNDGRVRRRAGRLAKDLLVSWGEIIATRPSICIELHEVSAQVPDAMTKWGLASYDAVHAVTAIYAGSPNMLTLDAGFSSVSARQLAIFVDRSRVRSCRNRRGGNATK